MSPIKRHTIATRLELIRKYLNRLQQFESVSLDEYRQDFDKQLIAERLLQLILEAATDINNYLLVRSQQGTSENYFDSFIAAGIQGIITPELAAQIAPSAGLGNRLVHQYEDIDSRQVFVAIELALQQYSLYVRQITIYLESLESGAGEDL